MSFILLRPCAQTFRTSKSSLSQLRATMSRHFCAYADYTAMPYRASRIGSTPEKEVSCDD